MRVHMRRRKVLDSAGCVLRANLEVLRGKHSLKLRGVIQGALSVLIKHSRKIPLSNQV